MRRHTLQIQQANKHSSYTAPNSDCSFFLPATMKSISISLLGVLVLSTTWTSQRSTLMAKAETASASVDSSTALKTPRRLTLDSMNPNVRKMEYAVRGKVVIAADAIQSELASSSDDDSHTQYPFDHIVYTNIGNPHSVGQKPLTWPRQVLALVDLPNNAGVDHPLAQKLFPADAIQRAQEIKTALGQGGSGAYSHSQGVWQLRKDVADFLEHRDGGVPAHTDDIFLTNGASNAINMILNALIVDSSTHKTGVMIPIPQYPIYSATIDLCNGHKVGYYLNEKHEWELDMAELERAWTEANEQGITVVAMVLINPGNPTGTVLKRDNMHQLIRFCVKHNLVLLADECYQENVYDEQAEFISCKRAAFEIDLLDQVELVSFHTVSKGVFGECGRRGGYMELVGIDPDVQKEIYKLASSSLCSTVSGQIMTSLMVRGPKEGDESFDSHEGEKRAIFDSLKRRSKLVSEGLNRIPGFSCQPAQGSMYCFPAVEMPPGALREAEKQGLSPDTLYCISLLEETGICVVPASGFGQREGRFGFRTTFLPSEEEMARVVEKIAEHYKSFCEKYAQ